MMIKKPKKIRSKKIRNAAKRQPCTLRLPGICNYNNQTTVFCHLNSKGKGMATKSSDLFGVFACSRCHYYLDQGKIGAESKLRGLIETQQILVDEGLINIE